MNTITITQNVSVKKKVMLPEYFISNDGAYRTEEDGRFTFIKNYSHSHQCMMLKGDRGETIVPEDIKPITKRQFISIFLTAISEIAGFKIDPDDWEDQEADVQQAKVIE